jgi:murein DD-endopeptidase MepM/ murein hydrolase activator NlpD
MPATAMLVLVLATVTADLGRAVRIALPAPPDVESVELIWQSKRVPFVRTEDGFSTIVGADLDLKPGKHEATVRFTSRGGATEERTLPILVNDVRYPTTKLTVAPEYVDLSAKDQARADEEAKEIEAIYSRLTPEMLWTKPFTVPIPGRKGTAFGHRRIFNGQPRAPHAGADLKAGTGTPVRSTNRGRVVLAKNLFFTGNTVIVDHGLGIYSLYAHLSRIDAKESEVVENGEVVGLAGATGRATGPHLHWGVRVQGARVDPFSLVRMGG